MAIESPQGDHGDEAIRCRQVLKQRFSISELKHSLRNKSAIEVESDRFSAELVPTAMFRRDALFQFLLQ